MKKCTPYVLIRNEERYEEFIEDKYIEKAFKEDGHIEWHGLIMMKI